MPIDNRYSEQVQLLMQIQPAVRWKLKNITRMSPAKHAEATERLRFVLNNLITEGLI